jgi:hypothetical protein
MKLVVALMALTLLVGCDREDKADELAPEGSIKLLVDSRELISEGVTAKLNNTTGEILLVTASFVSTDINPQISISAYSYNTNSVISTGEYEFGSKTDKGPYDGVCQYVVNDGNAPFSTTAVSESYVGKVNITEVDRAGLYVSGTFEATVGRNTEVKTITKGSFTKVKLTIN